MRIAGDNRSESTYFEEHQEDRTGPMHQSEGYREFRIRNRVGAGLIRVSCRWYLLLHDQASAFVEPKLLRKFGVRLSFVGFQFLSGFCGKPVGHKVH